MKVTKTVPYFRPVINQGKSGLPPLASRVSYVKKAITDEMWAIIEPLLRGNAKSEAFRKYDKRLVLEASLYKAQSTISWKNLHIKGFPPGPAVLAQELLWKRQGLYDKLVAIVKQVPEKD